MYGSGELLCKPGYSSKTAPGSDFDRATQYSRIENVNTIARNTGVNQPPEMKKKGKPPRMIAAPVAREAARAGEAGRNFPAAAIESGVTDWSRRTPGIRNIIDWLAKNSRQVAPNVAASIQRFQPK